MPVLKNPTHERFAQLKAKGVRNDEAYRQCGQCRTDKQSSIEAAAGRLMTRPEILARIAEIQGRAAEKAEVTLAEWLTELKRIAFHDVRNVVTWKDGVVTIRDADSLAPEHAATISEVSQTDAGALKIKMQDKKGALDMIGRYLGAYKDKVEHSGPDGGPIQISDTEAARRVAFLLAKGLNAP